MVFDGETGEFIGGFSSGAFLRISSIITGFGLFSQEAARVSSSSCSDSFEELFWSIPFETCAKKEGYSTFGCSTLGFSSKVFV